MGKDYRRFAESNKKGSVGRSPILVNNLETVSPERKIMPQAQSNRFTELLGANFPCGKEDKATQRYDDNGGGIVE